MRPFSTYSENLERRNETRAVRLSQQAKIRDELEDKVFRIPTSLELAASPAQALGGRILDGRPRSRSPAGSHGRLRSPVTSSQKELELSEATRSRDMNKDLGPEYEAEIRSCSSGGDE